ncbi:MAG: NAD(P)-binding domain-containing protein [Actinomycetota bacterium]|nr:NAD(P)-binding domain-containing protein [Actinomycetota bacterium]
MATIGFIGSGHVGQAIARRAIAAGHTVVMSNSRGPETLAGLVAAFGPRASAATATAASNAAEIVIVAIPFTSFKQVPVDPLAGKVVIDTGNYYAPRDGHVAELDDGTTTSSEMLASRLPTSNVVKAFNTIMAAQIVEHATPAGTPHRRALPIAGDDAAAKRLVTGLIDELGFDVVDAGLLAEGRRLDPMTAWAPALDAQELRRSLGLG